jgi:hypothetical protein
MISAGTSSQPTALGKYRRHSKDYEVLESSSESFIYITMIHLMARRLD